MLQPKERPALTSFTGTRLVQKSEYGKRIGETHPQAVLTDHEIDLVFELREAKMPVAEIAEKFEMSRGGIYKILNGSRRCCREGWAK